MDLLPREIGSLAHWQPEAPPGTLFAVGANGGMRVAPRPGFSLVFGRCEPEVHVCVGADDQYVSRRQGHIGWDGSRWVLTNEGRRPIRLPVSRLLLGGDQSPLASGYTPLFIVAPSQEHLLEIRIIGRPAPRRPEDGPDAQTREGEVWLLSEVEKLVLVCLGQSYLRGDPRPQPLTWNLVEAELCELRPEERWTGKRAAHIVAAVRRRLSLAGVRGVMEDEVPPPATFMINNNLIVELLTSTTLVRADLSLLEQDLPGRPADGGGVDPDRAQSEVLGELDRLEHAQPGGAEAVDIGGAQARVGERAGRRLVVQGERVHQPPARRATAL
jgi:hypothetical protein